MIIVQKLEQSTLIHLIIKRTVQPIFIKIKEIYLVTITIFSLLKKLLNIVTHFPKLESNIDYRTYYIIISLPSHSLNTVAKCHLKIYIMKENIITSCHSPISSFQ